MELLLSLQMCPAALVLLCVILFGHALTKEPKMEKNLDAGTHDDPTKGQLFKRGSFCTYIATAVHF